MRKWKFDVRFGPKKVRVPINPAATVEELAEQVKKRTKESGPVRLFLEDDTELDGEDVINEVLEEGEVIVARSTIGRSTSHEKLSSPSAAEASPTSASAHRRTQSHWEGGALFSGPSANALGGGVSPRGKTTVSPLDRAGVALLDAVREDDRHEVERVLGTRPSGVSSKQLVNYADENGVFALLVAAESGSVVMCEYLLGRGADVLQAESLLRDTAMHFASLSGDEAVAAALIAHDDRCLDVRNKNGQTPLFLAVRDNQVLMTRFLLGEGADRAIADRDGNTPLHVASICGHSDMVSMLCESLEDNERKNNQGWTPEEVASTPVVVERLNSVLDVLVAEKEARERAEREEREKEEMDEFAALEAEAAAEAELEAAAAAEAEAKAKAEAEAKAAAAAQRVPRPHATLRNKQQQQPASDAEMDPAVAALLNASTAPGVGRVAGRAVGRRASRLSAGDNSELIEGCRTGMPSIVNLLLRNPTVDINFENAQGETPLFIACANGKKPLVLLLIKEGAEVTKKSAVNGQTALHVAASHGQLAVCKLLLLHHAEMEAPDRNGCTPLHAAVKANKPEVVKFLLQRGASRLARDRRLNTPLHLACQFACVDVFVFLLLHTNEAAIKNIMRKRPPDLCPNDDVRLAFESVLASLTKYEREEE